MDRPRPGTPTGRESRLKPDQVWVRIPPRALEIRPATPADARAIAEVHVASWRAAYSGIVPDDWLDRLDVAERTRQWEGWIGRSIVLVTDGGDTRVVGFVAAHEESGEIAALYVAPDHTRRGLGTRLLAAVHERLRQAGRAEAHLWVFEANAAARAFYAARGYQPDGTTDVTAGQPTMRFAAAL
jgi:GNAT superfamily N-acetyltransferase